VPFLFHPQWIASVMLTIGLCCPINVLAYFPSEAGTKKPPTNTLPFPKEYTTAPIADRETQHMALEMETADCEKLEALNDEVKHIFMLVNIFMQRPGSLSKIVGPDCKFLGPAETIATIADDSLTLTGRNETLYYLPEMNAFLVSDKERNTIAYGLLREDKESDPLTYFLEHRNDAERSADIAKAFALTIEETVSLSSTKTTATSSLSSVASSQIEDAQKSSIKPFVPTPTPNTPPGFTPPADTVPPPEVLTPTPVYSDTDFPEVIYTERPQDGALPSIEPIGPEPEPVPEQSSGGMGYLILGFFLVAGLIIVAVIILKGRAKAAKGYEDN